VLFVVLMAWFASLAMEPAVSRLARRMRRPAATALVMLAVALFLLVFFALFGQLFVSQVAALVRGLPDILTNVLAWVNETFDQSYRLEDLLGELTIDPEQAAGYAGQIASRLFAILASVIGGIASFFMFLLFAFYLSADGPRLRFWIASLFPPAMQQFTLVAWDTTAEKTGGYVSARVILAAVNATASAVVFAIIGLPSWLALAIWTGLVAQFVPAIGTYIAISLPVLVGLLSDRPWTGIAALAWGIAYQQVENLALEPRISARAVNVHPAVSFASVILGGALFGVAGALLAIPVAAMLLTLLDLYRTRYALVPELAASPEAREADDSDSPDEPPETPRNETGI
jgi:predicted PurR-regulated permease PerM